MPECRIRDSNAIPAWSSNAVCRSAYDKRRLADGCDAVLGPPAVGSDPEPGARQLCSVKRRSTVERRTHAFWHQAVAVRSGSTPGWTAAIRGGAVVDLHRSRGQRDRLLRRRPNWWYRPVA